MEGKGEGKGEGERERDVVAIHRLQQEVRGEGGVEGKGGGRERGMWLQGCIGRGNGGHICPPS